MNSLLVNNIVMWYTATIILSGGTEYALATGTGQALVLWAVLVCCVIAMVVGAMDVYETYQTGRKKVSDGKKRDIEMSRDGSDD